MVRALNSRGLLVAASAIALFSVVACSSSSSPANNTTTDGGSSKSSGSSNTSGSKSSTSGSKSSGSASESGSQSSTSKSTGTGSASGSSTSVSAKCDYDAGTGQGLYQRLGGHAGIRAAVNAVVGKELKNADIGSYFFNQTNPPTAGHPTADQIEECFTDFVGNALGGPEQYPTTLDADAGGGTTYACRDLKTAHAKLEINGGTFTEFLVIAGGELATLGVCPQDINLLAGALEGTAPDIVTIDGGALEAYPGAATGG